jgi:uncharacterized membrane protein
VNPAGISYNQRVNREIDWHPQTDPVRLLALSDGIFSVAMTLAAVQILPEGLSKRLIHEGSYAVLSEMWPQFVGVCMTFVLVGFYWITHHRIFSYIRRTSKGFLSLNMIFLLGITLMPFSVQLATLPPSDVNAVIVYAVYVGALGLLLTVIWSAAVRGRLTDPHLDPRIVRYNHYRSLISSVIFLLSVPVALVLGANVARWCWLLVFLNDRIAKKLAQRAA